MTITYGSVPLDEALALSGMEFLSAIRDGRLPHPPIAETAGLRLVTVEPGFIVWEGEPTSAYFNPLGGIHGGWIATLLDSCMGCAGHTTLAAGIPYTTIDLKVNYVRAVTPKVGVVRAEGKVLHAGRKLLSTEGRLVDANGKLYAHGVSACITLDAPAQTLR